MILKSIFIIFISLVTAAYAIIHIYSLAILSLRYAGNILESSNSHSSSFLIIDPIFWSWTAVAWLASYILIKNYLILQEYLLR